MLLRPISFLYGCVVNLRNGLFDVGIIQSREFDHPVICVGNLTVGGTGKTPHSEMLVRMMLEEGLSVATLSRGYKRKTKGFRVATADSTAREIGDEPLQMAREFPTITVAVDENRCRGIGQLLAAADRPDVIILDDAYQHRYVKAGMNILLVDYNRPAHSDRMLPEGRLREPFSGKRRADIVIVTKCPSTLSPIEMRVLTQELKLMPYQKLFFSTLVDGDLYPLFGTAQAKAKGQMPLKQLRNIEYVLLVAGIANPEQLRQDLMKHTQRVKTMAFADHHSFTANDVARINDAYASLAADDKIIITTAKDATRLALVADQLTPDVRRAIYVLPVSVQFLREEGRTFKRIVMDYVKTSSPQPSP